MKDKKENKKASKEVPKLDSSYLDVSNVSTDGSSTPRPSTDVVQEKRKRTNTLVRNTSKFFNSNSTKDDSEQVTGSSHYNEALEVEQKITDDFTEESDKKKKCLECLKCNIQ